MLQAAPQLYDITLSNAERYTQCKITYETDSVIKFRGTDKSGKVVTKEVKASSVLVRKEVKPLVRRMPLSPRLKNRQIAKKAKSLLRSRNRPKPRKK